MPEITVIDSIMGSGKTSWAIQHMSEADASQRFVYITPFLDEVTRVKTSVTGRVFLEPNNANDESSKMTSLKDLIANGRDIVSTHALFKRADDELVALLKDAGYTLILDEVMDCVEGINVRASDIRKLEGAGDIRIGEDDKRVHWIGDPFDDSRYRDIRELAQAGNLFYHRGKFLVWAFPPSVFRAVDNVVVMTYLFRGQAQRYYFDLFRFHYDYQAISKTAEGRYELAPYNKRAEGRGEMYALMNVYEGKLNDVGSRKNALSATHLRRADVELLAALRNNLYNYFGNIAKAKKDDVYYSTLKEIEAQIQPRGYKKQTIAINARATNEYADRWAVAYLFNRYNNPHINSFFQDNGVSINEDMLAVGDLLQWIYRSRIRQGGEIHVYVPSSRMRSLLKAWANYDI